MAKKQKEARRLVKLVGRCGYIYYTEKNTKNTVDKINLRKYNPITRKHELFKEKK